jgi:hypothetical protein
MADGSGGDIRAMPNNTLTPQFNKVAGDNPPEQVPGDTGGSGKGEKTTPELVPDMSSGTEKKDDADEDSGGDASNATPATSKETQIPGSEASGDRAADQTDHDGPSWASRVKTAKPKGGPSR